MSLSLLLLALLPLVGEPESNAPKTRLESNAPAPRVENDASKARTEPAPRAVESKVESKSGATNVARAKYTLDEILIALRHVETGGERQGGRHAVGDGGIAIGPYQIQRAYWADAKVPGRYEDCRDPRYARAVVLAYWKRYCPKALEALDAQTLARVHNGGPDGHREDCTLKFWRKLERELVKVREEAAKPSKERAPVEDAKPVRKPAEKPVLV